MRKFIYILLAAATLFYSEIIKSLIPDDFGLLFQEKRIVLFESLIIEKHEIGEENYNALHRFFNAPTIANQTIAKIFY